jgi:hypothetical protein
MSTGQVPKTNILAAGSRDNIVGHEDRCGAWQQSGKSFAADLHIPHFNYITGGEMRRVSSPSLALSPQRRNQSPAWIECSVNKFAIVR